MQILNVGQDSPPVRYVHIAISSFSVTHFPAGSDAESTKIKHSNFIIHDNSITYYNIVFF